jgi:hypothetical protein
VDDSALPAGDSAATVAPDASSNTVPIDTSSNAPPAPAAEAPSVIGSPLAPPTILPTAPTGLPTPDMPISLLGQPAALSDDAIAPFAGPAGPGATMLAGAAAAGSAVLVASPHAGASRLHSQPDKPATLHKPEDPGGPSLPCGGGAGGSAVSAACSSGSGSSHGIFLALLMTLGGLAVLLSTMLRLPPAHWRPAAFIALLERPG